MRGHIQQRGKESWRLKAYVGHDEGGTKRYVYRTVRGTRREAERELSRLLVEVGDGLHVAAAAMRFGELLDRWLEVKAMTVEASTVDSYRWVANTYLRPVFGDRPLASIRTLELGSGEMVRGRWSVVSNK